MSKAVGSSRRVLCFLLLYIAVPGFMSYAQNGRRPNFLPAPGPYPVGLTVTEITDDSRPPLPDTALGVHASGRRLQVFEWYPARANGAVLGVLDYFRLANATSEKDWKTQEVPADLVKGFGPTTVPMLAHADATPVGGRFPLVIYAPSLSASPIENADLCEFLASEGYMVLSTPSMGPETRQMTDGVNGVRSQARDISFLIDYAKSRPDADTNQTAVVGYSWGGLANVYAATQDSRIKALASLDGSIRYYVSVAWDAEIHPEQMTLPLLLFTQGYIALESDLVNALILKGRTSLVSAWTHGDVYRIEMAAMQHSAFASMNLRKDAFGDQALAQPEYDREEAKVSFHAVAQYTLAFLNTYLKSDGSGRAFLKQTSTVNGMPKHLLYPEFSPATGIASTLEALRSAVEKVGYGHASEVFAKARQSDPTYKVDEKALLAWGGGDLLDRGQAIEAIEVFKLAVAMYPSSSPGYSGLGAAYLKTGQIALARDNFAKAVQLNPEDYFAVDQLNTLKSSPSPSN